MNSLATTNKINFRSRIFDGFTFAYLFLVALILLAQPTQEQLLDVGFYTIVFISTWFLGALLSQTLLKAGVITWGEHLFEPIHLKSTSEERPLLKSFWGWHLFIVLAVTFYVGFLITKTNLSDLLDEQGRAGALRIFSSLATPNFKLLPTAILNIITTVYMAFIATALAIPLAFVLSFFCAKNIMKHPAAYWVYLSLRTFLNVTRSIEALIWAIIFSVWVGIGPFAGVMALMIHSVASLAKQYSEMVESISHGPIEGIESTGANFLQTIWYAVVPQVILPYISFTVYRWDINVRMATIIGLTGGGGIGTLLSRYNQQGLWHEVGTIILVIAVVVWLMDQASAVIREALK